MAVVVITGCSSGIGLETALAFAARGDSVAATVRDAWRADRLDQRAAGAGLGLDVTAMDVTSDATVTNAIEDVTRRLGPIDVLVNNAGAARLGPVETIPIDQARATDETNFWGPVRTIRAVLPAMRERHRGVIVNVTSLAARLPGVACNGFYYASKHALSALSESLAAEVGPFGVRVVCIEPGNVLTDLSIKNDWDHLNPGPYAADEAWIRKRYKASAAAGRDSRDVAAAILAAVDDP